MELKQKDINLLLPMQKKPGMSPGKKKKIELIALPILLLVFFLAFAGSYMVRTMKQNREKEQIEGYMSSMAPVYDQAKQVESEMQTAQGLLNVIGNAQKNIQSYPLLRRQVLDTVYGNLSGGMRITALDLNEQGQLTITCSSTGVDRIPAYVDSLKQSEQFSSITYLGFKGSGQDGYTFTVNATPKAGE